MAAQPISREIKIKAQKFEVFRLFIEEIGSWWPKEYTWSREKLVNLQIENKVNGLCTETGPYNFRCDWGRVTELVEEERLGLKWQIGPNRQPLPNPDMASDILLQFSESGGITRLSLKHYNFQHHGDGAEGYREMMDSEQGWDYILQEFKNYVERNS